MIVGQDKQTIIKLNTIIHTLQEELREKDLILYGIEEGSAEWQLKASDLQKELDAYKELIKQTFQDMMQALGYAKQIGPLNFVSSAFYKLFPLETKTKES